MSGKVNKSVAQFAIEAGQLRAALKGVTDVVEARNTIPVLSNLRLTTANGRLRIEGSDLDLWVVRHIDVAQDAGTPAIDTTVNAATLKAIVAKLPSDGVAIFALHEPGRMTVTSGRAKFVLPTLPSDDFPSLTAGELPHRFEIPAFNLAAAIGASRFAVSTEETRYYLCGLFVHATDVDGERMLRIAATDGHRLARFTLPLPEGAGEIPDAIIPSKAVKLIDTMIEGREAPVEIALSSSRVSFDLGETVVTSKLIDGQFPDYTRVIPSDNDKIVSIDRAALIAATERVMLISSEKTRAVKLAFDRDQVTLSVVSPESGSATEDVPCDYAGPPIVIGFNGKYLVDVANHVQGDAVAIELRGPADATVLRDGNDAARALYVLMPLRV